MSFWLDFCEGVSSWFFFLGGGGWFYFVGVSICFFLNLLLFFVVFLYLFVF